MHALHTHNFCADRCQRRWLGSRAATPDWRFMMLSVGSSLPQAGGYLTSRAQYTALLNALATVSLALGRVFVPPQLLCMDADAFP